MKWSMLILVVLTLLVVPHIAAQNPLSEEATAMTPTHQQNGLHGRVKTCTEESSYPAVADAEGKKLPETRSKFTTEYDLEGRTIQTRSGNSDGTESVTHYVYNAAGKLLKTASGVEGQPMEETIYSYDSQGRLQSISNDGRSENPVTFRYDEHGRKSMIATSRPEDYRPNMATGESFELAGMAPNLPDGGTATTIYDEHDRGAEVEVRNSGGELVSRRLRTFDAQGRVVEDKVVLENFAAALPKEFRTTVAEESGLTPEQIKQGIQEELNQLMAGKTEMYLVSYKYDAKGRLTQRSRRVFNHQEQMETAYNENGDIASEINRSTVLPVEPSEGGPAAGPPSYYETRYSYQYDAFGNWTEKTISSRFTPDGEFQPSSVVKRTLTYY